MDKKEFKELNRLLAKFYEDHSLEFYEKEMGAMKLVKSMVVDYITHFGGE